MSKARLVITAVVVEGRTQTEVAKMYGVSKGWVSKLIARYNAEGETAFEPRSRRPKTSPDALEPGVAAQILQLREQLSTAGLDAGPDTIAWHLERHHQTVVSRSTISRHLARAGLVTPEPKMKKWLRAQPVQPTTTVELQALLDAFVEEYNHRRPHRSLPHRSTPGTRYDTMPKAMPGDSRDPDTHDRTRHDRVDKAGSVTIRHNGRLHHIGVGRTYEGTCVILLVQDLEIRVVNAITGELLRELTLNPHIDYQPTGAPKGPTRKPRK